MSLVENEYVGEVSSVKLPKNCKENRYYYRHREEILEKKRQKRLEDPEYKAKYEERQKKKAEREEVEKQREEKRKLRKKVVEQILNAGTEILSGAN
jgi:hypothetical protein